MLHEPEQAALETGKGLDGLSLQSADQGRCECADCAKRSPAEHHADILIRSAEYVRSQRPDWIIGQAGWGLPIDMGDGFEHVVRTSAAFDYIVEVQERTAFAGRRVTSAIRVIPPPGQT